jgi:sec-independent protein translocase protein TatA
MYLGWAPGPWEIILVVLVVLLLFGGRKIPELMRGLGKGVKEFKEGIAEDEKTDSDDAKDKKEDK